MSEKSIPGLAGQLVNLMLEHRVHIATAESCTGGLLAGAITGVPGSSGVFEQGFVTYSNEAKTDLLAVAPELLREHGAVSMQVAQAMARGLAARTGAGIALSVTGIAGPDGGSLVKPVGLVHFGVASRRGVRTVERRFGSLERGRIRDLSVLTALELAFEELGALAL